MTKLGLLDVGGKKYSLNLGETYFVGNKSSVYPHDIEIDDASIDIKHCLFDCTERLPKLFDLRSKVGTFVDGMRVPACQMTPLKSTSIVQFGIIEATFQLLSEGDSGYLEVRLTSPPKDTSTVISNSPEHVTSSVMRLKHTLKNSLTSTPNATNITNSVMKDASEFLIPTEIPRKSVGGSTSARSVDSFYIPETQCPVENKDGAKHLSSASIDTNESKSRCANICGEGDEGDEDDDFFIPETQDVGRLSNYPRVAFNNGDKFESVADDDKIPSSQFRICTQDFNGSDDNLSNHSDDILANVPCSLIIPQIQHSPVRIDDILNPIYDEEIEKEMSALQWSKRTGEDVEGSVTGDVINPVNGSITPDIIEHVGKVIATAAVTQCNTPDMFANPDQSDCDQANKSLPAVPQDVQPTQVFVKPASMSSSFIKPPLPPCDKENIGPQEDELCLPSTQVFMPPPVRIKSASSFVTPAPPPTPIKVSSFVAEEDLPPTQVFQKDDVAPTTTACFSSTLIDNVMQLSENSFRAKCNKFLDSDDDEMDEVIAPELVKNMRESVKQCETPKAPPTAVSSNSAPKVKKSPQKEKTPKEEPKSVSKKKDHVHPTTATKKSSHPHVAVSIDNFLFTPDFLGKEFSKDKNLQELAEVNWKNIISEKQRKSLFGSSTDESDGSQDSFNDLLPNKIISAAPNLEKSNASEKQKPERKLSRRRKSMVEEESKTKKVPRKADTAAIELVSDNKEKKDSETQRVVVPTVQQHSHESKDKLKESHKGKAAAPDNKEKNETRAKRDVLPTVELRSHDSKGRLKESANEESAALASRPRRKTKSNREECQNDDKASKARSKSRMSEKVSKSSAPKIMVKRTTRHSTKELESESKHHTENKSSSHNRPNGVIDKSVDNDRRSDGSIPKAPEQNEKNNNDKKGDKEDTKSKEASKQETEIKPLPRLTRLRSAKELATKKHEVDVSEKRSDRVKKSTETSTDSNAKSKQASSTTGKDRSHHRKYKDDATSSSLQDTSHNTKPSSIGSIEGTKTATTSKRKNEVPEALVKRLRSNSSTDSVVSTRSNESRRLRRTQKPKIAMTMCDPRYQGILEKHSGALWLYTKDPKECDVMVVEKGNRTFKIMVAIARGIPVVKLDWLLEVLKRKSVDIPYEQFLFEDPEFQNRHQFDMKKSLHLARTTSLLEGMSFLMTPGIRPIPSELKDIIVCAGGTVLECLTEQQENDNIYLVSETKDQKHWHQYRRMNANIKIVSSEGVMASVMQQSQSPLRKSVII